MNNAPIFIGGLAHSGKTVLRLMLLAQPHLSISRKVKLWNEFFNRYGNLSEPQNFERCLRAMLKNKQVQTLAPDEQRIRGEFSQGKPSYARLFALFYAHEAERQGKTRWGTQLGFVERLADPIFAAYPSAKMIHMVRDPRDRNTAVKSITRHRKGKTGWSTAKWIYSASLAWRNQKRYPDNYLVVHYESLVSNPEATMRQICDFIDEPYLPEMLAPLKESDTAVAPSLLSNQEIIFTQTAARQQMLDLGYSLATPKLSWHDRLLLYLVDGPANWLSLTFWNLYKARTIGKYVRS